jgi:5-methylcytosine-specific restriction endonuclease McrA
MRGIATAFDIGPAGLRPVTWEEWRTLPVREQDMSVSTIHGPIRVPTVVCKSSYAKMPKKRPKLNAKGVALRDNMVCQYTGRHAPDGNVDHIVPRSRGGKHAWENVVWSSRKVNNKKGSKLNHEAGLKLLRKPPTPGEVPFCATVQPEHDDWAMFLNS